MTLICRSSSVYDWTQFLTSSLTDMTLIYRLETKRYPIVFRITGTTQSNLVDWEWWKRRRTKRLEKWKVTVDQSRHGKRIIWTCPIIVNDCVAVFSKLLPNWWMDCGPSKSWLLLYFTLFLSFNLYGSRKSSTSPASLFLPQFSSLLRQRWPRRSFIQHRLSLFIKFGFSLLFLSSFLLLRSVRLIFYQLSRMWIPQYDRYFCFACGLKDTRSSWPSLHSHTCIQNSLSLKKQTDFQ